MFFNIGDAKIKNIEIKINTNGKFKRTTLDNGVILIVAYNADDTVKYLSASHKFRIDDDRNCIVFDTSLKNEDFEDIQ